jgi:hypothetical protein
MRLFLLKSLFMPSQSIQICILKTASAFNAFFLIDYDTFFTITRDCIDGTVGNAESCTSYIFPEQL